MALSLVCVCDSNASICVLQSLIWKGTISVSTNGTIGCVCDVTLSGTTINAQLLGVVSGPFAVTLPLSTAVAEWGSLHTTIFINASLFQVPSPAYSQSQSYAASYVIEQNYQCTNLVTGVITHRKINAIDAGGGLVQCLTAPGDLRGEVFGGGGFLGANFFKSTPLGACLSGGISTSNGGYSPPPQANMIDIDHSAPICLCATGGSGHYTFSVVKGSLPGGQSLNPDTGCVEGTPDGSFAGTPNVTFHVIDSGSPSSPGPPQEAEVTCGFAGGDCGAGTGTPEIGNISY